MFNTIRRKLFAVAVAAVIVAVLSQGTLAFISTVNTATNVITSGNVRFSIHQLTDTPCTVVIPGDRVTEAVCVQSDCTHPFYLRMRPQYRVNSETLAADGCFKLNVDETVWQYRDGWYYYVSPVQAGGITPYLFTCVEIVGERVDNRYIGKTLTVTMEAQAVQSENNPLTDGAVWTAQGWPQEAEV